MTLHVLFARHGETVWHAENRYAGATDVDLSERGRDQAEQLAQWAAGARLDGVWASTLVRSRETAQPAADRAGLPLHIDERLREIDFGAAEGLTVAELQESMPACWAAFEADPGVVQFAGGEDPADVVRRYQDALDHVRSAHPHGRVLVVGHSTAIRLTLCQLLGIALSEYRRVFPSLHNCSVCEVRLGHGTTGLLSLNVPARQAVSPTDGVEEGLDRRQNG